MTTTEPNRPPAPVSRRSFLSRSAVAGLGVALVGSVDQIFGATPASAAPGGQPGRPVGYGELVPDPRGLLSLPPGFSYTVVSHAGETRLESGEFSPSDPDGTAAFARPRGQGAVLVQNHEINGTEPFPVPALAGFTYDANAGGGTTTLEVDQHGNRIGEYVSLAGTQTNCAGGRTPWNTWLTCEETEDLKGKAGSRGALLQDHGYVFEVDPHDRNANRDPQPIKALGRFAHEAVVVNPDTFELYLTEDASNPNGLLYRYTPPASARPLGKGSLKRLGPTDGTLEAMRATTGTGTHVPDLSVARLGDVYRLEWVAVPDRDARTLSTRKQAYAQPITRSRKLEGMWWGDGGAYVVASFARTSDGSAAQHDGQVWFLDPVAQTITLQLLFAYTPGDQDSDPDGPDNITVSPYGGIILAEDGEGAQHLLGANSDGKTFFLARNEVSESEFAGPTFAPDRKVLFAAIQEDGYTFAIQGPFTRQH
ncbi:alkaline phosphatase PhoX [Blastococcus sp. URHD0036]|uniref:alkaline phosphatase PhoX n=1 Tax=Blastococcus sp. URHD0036 TaxID=1380356 RepID=UPI000497126E|nr:alkaline phosphatase PhoX [Blastococcus sp. URHD0036]